MKRKFSNRQSWQVHFLRQAGNQVAYRIFGYFAGTGTERGNLVAGPHQANQHETDSQQIQPGQHGNREKRRAGAIILAFHLIACLTANRLWMVCNTIVVRRCGLQDLVRPVGRCVWFYNRRPIDSGCRRSNRAFTGDNNRFVLQHNTKSDQSQQWQRKQPGTQ